MNYFLALLLVLSAGYLIFRVVTALFTGVLRYKPRYQPERVVRFREARREFIVIILIFTVVSALVLWTAWTLLAPSRSK